MAGCGRPMSPTNQGGNASRGKTRIVKLKSHRHRKLGTPANPHEYWIRVFWLMLQRQLFRHRKTKKRD
jgi:hypothetical protein